jgi:TetR/AcrR family transcriptional regulator, fatty acid metabolism regulator protein
MGQSKEEKRKILLQAASDVLLELGLHKTTLDDIAHRAGMAKTSLYYYFKDKNEIIREIIRNDHDQLLEIMTKAIDAANTAEEKMFALSEARYRFIANRALRASKEIVNEFRSLAGVFEGERENYLQSHKELIERILREGIRKKEIKPIEDLELVSLIMVASMFGCDQTFAFYDQRERVLDGIKRMIRIFFAGLNLKQ